MRLEDTDVAELGECARDDFVIVFEVQFAVVGDLSASRDRMIEWDRCRGGQRRWKCRSGRRGGRGESVGQLGVLYTQTAKGYFRSA